ncbi:NAD(P)/FAD-dependent oxidoreductase [Nocardia callitridis]|uniref:D-amino-acid oxidase n=1 Tax=Nocardia callitridis TaxID=648753 RepID=A0ABP9K2U2_9NOCA
MRVVVVGSGISGLSTAAELLRDGHQVTIISAEAVSATTSFLAAAVWFPTAAGPEDLVREWGRATFAHLEGLAVASTPGVRMCESLALYREPPAIPEWAPTVRDFRPAEPACLPDGYTHGFRFVVPLVEMPIYLPYLHDQVAASGARWLYRYVNRLDDVADLRPDVIVNCAGLRAGALVDDPAMHPIRGQIVRVRNPGLSMSIRDEQHPLGRAYVHPRARDCVLGGSLDVDAWDRTPNPELTQSILERCRDLAPELADCEVLETLVGLRPGRATVRLEIDHDTVDGIPVVHNYGHGGSGVTIGHGCARAAAALAHAL